MFVHVRGRATYSMLEGIGSHNQVFQLSKDLGHKALALTDLYGLYGVVDFYSKSKSFDIKPLIGVELPYTSHFSTLTQTKGIIKKLGTLTLLVENAVGYHNLLRIVSKSYEYALDDVPCVDSQVLAEFSEGIVALVGGLGSVVYNAIVVENNPHIASLHIEQVIASLGKENVVFDITAQPYTDYPDLRRVNDFIRQSHTKYGGMILTSSGYLYPTADQQSAYDTALAIKDGKRNYDPDARKTVGQHHILSEEEIRSILQNNDFSDTEIDVLIEATGEFADRCTAKITLGQALFPNYDTPPDMRAIYAEVQDTLIE